MSDKFPKPNIQSCDIDAPGIQRVPLEKMDIASRKSGIPTSKEMTGDQKMSIDHVGGSTKK